MEKWMIIWTNKADVPGVLERDEQNGVATFDTRDEAQRCWDAHPLSKVYSAWAFDVVNGDVEAL